jgi:hypothetical protein
VVLSGPSRGKCNRTGKRGEDKKLLRKEKEEPENQMTKAREIFLNQGQGPGQGAHLRGSLQATFGLILEPSVKATRRIGPRPVDNFVARERAEWTHASQH